MNGAVGVQVRAILANGKFWSGILCAASFSRGTAYLERPPEAITLAGKAIEAYVPYRAWGVVLLVTCVLIILGHLMPRLRWAGMAGHVLSVFAYGTFGLSLGIASFVGNQSWANTGLYLVGATLHFACAVYFADEVSRHRQGGTS